MLTAKTARTVSSLVTVVLLSRVQVIQTPRIVRNQHTTDKKSEVLTMNIQKAKEETLWGMFIADALAMPVHWYYNPEDIKDGYGGWLTGYREPEKNHPSSILTLSAVDGSGRSGWGSKTKPVIGHVILHNKLKYWTSRDQSVHYHQGMKAGDSTLNSLTALECLKTMSRVDPNSIMPSRDLRGMVLEDYVKFMTTPGTHNDTYAESFHRSFFKDWVLENQPPKTAEDLLVWTENRFKSKSGHSDSQLIVIGALVPAVPWVVHYADKPEDDCVKATIDIIKLTHPEESLIPYIEIYARLLHRVLNGKDLTEEVKNFIGHKKLGGSPKRKIVETLLEKAKEYPFGSEKRLQIYQMATGRLGSACYIEGALSSMMFLALEFADHPNEGLLANANCGGENCHRGAALGALLGASASWKGKPISDKYKEHLGSAKPQLVQILDAMQSKM
ncbi:uncharacterized protein LOC127737609 [Mytilus californianus]|uniref:uncharacterized protein LOC127737609 n=1 Tax=Mytilus californianus TaxID=6549 RepID=UPI002246AE6F|nr:uncharacterized protein LOC127737609 [Mytilus californianus]XP_052104412.1 uncharacterized protein LOC127737609 [Mytilus californianus]